MEKLTEKKKNLEDYYQKESLMEKRQFASQDMMKPTNHQNEVLSWEGL